MESHSNKKQQRVGTMTTPSLLRITSLVILCLLPVLATSQLTIPRRTLGYVYRRSVANRSDLVTLTAYLDLTCSDSQQAFPTLIKLADQLSGANFELVVRSFSLPYHRNSHTITEAVHIIDQYTRGEGVFPFITDVFKNLDSLTTSATREKTDFEVLDILAPIVTEASGISAIEFKKKIAETSYDAAARLDFKYGCTRGVYGTPTFMINDVVVAGQPSWTVDQWLEKIKPLLRWT